MQSSKRKPSLSRLSDPSTALAPEPVVDRQVNPLYHVKQESSAVSKKTHRQRSRAIIHKQPDGDSREVRQNRKVSPSIPMTPASSSSGHIEDTESGSGFVRKPHNDSPRPPLLVPQGGGVTRTTSTGSMLGSATCQSFNESTSRQQISLRGEHASSQVESIKLSTLQRIVFLSNSAAHVNNQQRRFSFGSLKTSNISISNKNLLEIILSYLLREMLQRGDEQKIIEHDSIGFYIWIYCNIHSISSKEIFFFNYFVLKSIFYAAIQEKEFMSKELIRLFSELVSRLGIITQKMKEEIKIFIDKKITYHVLSEEEEGVIDEFILVCCGKSFDEHKDDLIKSLLFGDIKAYLEKYRNTYKSEIDIDIIHSILKFVKNILILYQPTSPRKQASRTVRIGRNIDFLEELLSGHNKSKDTSRVEQDMSGSIISSDVNHLSADNSLYDPLFAPGSMTDAASREPSMSPSNLVGISEANAGESTIDMTGTGGPPCALILRDLEATDSISRVSFQALDLASSLFEGGFTPKIPRFVSSPHVSPRADMDLTSPGVSPRIAALMEASGRMSPRISPRADMDLASPSVSPRVVALVEAETPDRMSVSPRGRESSATSTHVSSDMGVCSSSNSCDDGLAKAGKKTLSLLFMPEKREPNTFDDPTRGIIHRRCLSG